MADSGYKSISRIDVDRKRMHGFQVRVWFRGVMHTKFFSDGAYAGPEEALAEAVMHRDELEASLGKPRSEKPVLTVPNTFQNKVRIRRTRRQIGSFSEDGYPKYSDVFQIYWMDAPYRSRCRSFSIPKYGEKEAYRLARLARDAQQKKLDARGQKKGEQSPPKTNGRK